MACGCHFKQDVEKIIVSGNVFNGWNVVICWHGYSINKNFKNYKEAINYLHKAAVPRKFYCDECLAKGYDRAGYPVEKYEADNPI